MVNFLAGERNFQQRNSGKAVSYQLFDLTRYTELQIPELAQDYRDMDDDFELPCLKTSAMSDRYESYLDGTSG